MAEQLFGAQLGAAREIEFDEHQVRLFYGPTKLNPKQLWADCVHELYNKGGHSAYTGYRLLLVGLLRLRPSNTVLSIHSLDKPG